MNKDDIERVKQRRHNALNHPFLYVGPKHTGHLVVLREPLKVSCISPAFSPPQKVQVALDGCCARVCVWSEGMRDEFSQLIDWTAYRNYFDLLDDLTKNSLVALNTPSVQLAAGGQVSIGALGAGMELWKRGYLCIRSQGSYWFQSITDGIPDLTLVRLCSNTPVLAGIGITWAMEFPKNVLTHLPYQVSEVRTFQQSVFRFNIEVIGETIDDCSSPLGTPSKEA